MPDSVPGASDRQRLGVPLDVGEMASNSGNSLETHHHRSPSLNSNPEPKPLTTMLARLCQFLSTLRNEEHQVFSADAELLETADTNETLSHPHALGTSTLLPAENLQGETWPQERPRAPCPPSPPCALPHSRDCSSPLPPPLPG